MYPDVGYVPGTGINPANSTLFPWLSTIAPQFERYHFNSLKLSVVSKNPTSAAGRIYAAVDYDFNDGAPVSLTQMMANATAKDAAAWDALEMVIPPANLNRDMAYKYTLDNSNTDVENRTTYDGYLILATDGLNGTCNWDIYLSYDVELLTPQLSGYASEAADEIIGGIIPNNGVYFFPKLPVTNSTPTVVPGTQSPYMNVNSLPAPLAYDISSSLGKYLDLVYVCNSAGHTPAELCASAIGSIFNVVGFDGIGNLLTIPSADAFRAVAPKLWTEYATAGKDVIAAVNIDMDSLRHSLPTLKYIIPYFYNTSGLTTSSGTLGMTLSS